MTAEIDYMIIIKSRAGEQKRDLDSCTAMAIPPRIDLKNGDEGAAIRH